MVISIWQIIILLLMFISTIWISGRILNKAGYSRWWVLLIFVPVVNLIMIWVFAFAKWPRLEQAEVLKQAVGEVVDKTAEVIKLAVIPYEERSGSLKLMGEDTNGRRFNLIEITQPALLFVPRETLPYLKRNEKLWSRVQNPDASFDEKSSLKQASEAEGGLLAAVLAGPLMDSIKAGDLLPGEFRINVVDTYAEATMKVNGVGLFE